MPLDLENVTHDSIREKTLKTLAEASAIADDAIAQGTTFETLLARLEEAGSVISDSFGSTAFMGYVHPDREIRQAGKEAQESLEKWGLEIVFREDLYRAVKAYSESSEAQELTGEKRRLLDFTLRDLRRIGHDLDSETRARLKELNNRLIELGVAFENNIAAAEDSLELTRQDLEGLSDDYITSLEPGTKEGTFRVTMAYPHVTPFLENAVRRDLREELSYKFNTRAVDKNRPILIEAIAIRREIASFFGKPSWAHHRMEVQMAKSPENVEAFYADLIPPLTQAASTEITRLSKMLAADTGDSQLQAYDWRYYDTRLRKTEYGVDQSLVSQYFPLESVIEGLFGITAEVFGLAFRHVELPRWHPDVRTYAIDDSSTGDLIAYVYMDLFPREGKFSHAAAFTLAPGRLLRDGSYSTPVSAIVANFTKPTSDKPSLMRHSEVETLFHEFGHILHQTLTRAEMPSFSGTNTERDFVEAPSQIMEHWTWKPEVLARFAHHHKTGEPMPSDLVEKLTAAKHLNVALTKLRQISFGLLDLAFHGPGPSERDMDAILEDTTKVSLLPLQPGTFFPASFGHLLGGYDAGYYGYLWSEVYGDDMFSRFEEAGYLNSDVGMDYRRKILEKGGSVDAIEMLRDFLGREPNNAAFLKALGIAE